MNRIVTRHHVPAAEVPPDLRGDIPSSALVTITIAEEEPTGAPADPIELLRRFVDNNPEPTSTLDEAVARVRRLRDEWDD